MVHIGSYLGSNTRKESNMMNTLNGKKTYIVAAIAAAAAAASALGYEIPEWTWLLLNAAGLGAVRNAIGR